MTALVAIFAVLAIAALSGWAWTLIQVSRAVHPNAQGIQLLLRVNDIIDDRVRSVLTVKDRAQGAKAPEGSRSGGDDNMTLADIEAKAKQFGFTVKGGNVTRTPLGPIPDAPGMEIDAA